MFHRRSVLLVCLLELGCQSELELPPVIEASEHLVLRGEDEVCAGTFDETEARVIVVQDLFEVPATQVEYNWLLDRFPEAECVQGASECARGEDIFARDLGVEHELIHASRSDFSLPEPLEEGLATFLGGNRMPVGTRDEFRAAIESGETFSYMRASEFVQLLVELGGFEKLRELASLTHYEMPFSEWRTQLEKVYGMSWGELWDVYLASPECEPLTMHDDVLLCYSGLGAVENLTPGLMDSSQYVYEMSCDDPLVIGPVNGDELRHEVLVQFDEVSIQTVNVTLIGDVVEGSYATLTRCGTCGGEQGAVLTPGKWYPLAVDPGVYVLDLRQPIDAPGLLGIHVQF
jgi:hypothetical protein